MLFQNGCSLEELCTRIVDLVSVACIKLICVLICINLKPQQVFEDWLNLFPGLGLPDTTGEGVFDHCSFALLAADVQ
jgi:hypothetical protein